MLEQAIIKFGMSMRLEYRWHDYDFPKPEYLVQYCLPNKSKEDILLIESDILFETNKYEYDNEKIEWRKMDWKQLNEVIEDYLRKNNIKYEKLTGNQIKQIKPPNNYKSEPTNRTKQLKVRRNKDINKSSKLIPLEYQDEIINKLNEYYKENDNGRLYLPCGTGKTFIGFWTFNNLLKYKSVCIFVPSLYLLNDTMEFWKDQLQYYENEFHFISIGSETSIKNINATTDKEIIKNELKQSYNVIVISTYQSSNLLLDSCKELNFKFDLSIFDEAHRSTGEVDKQFTLLLSDDYKISRKKLFMTATEKVFDYSNKEDEERILSMNNEEIYGKVIYIKSLRQAIEDGALVDYNIIAPFISSDNILLKKGKTIEEINNNKISLAIMVLETMKRYKFTHLLIFSQLNKDAEKITKAIESVLSYYYEDEYVYNKYLSSNDSMKNRKIEVEKFKKAKIGIISSARIFNEGVNIKICDAICFADNKESSVDIIQCVGRCLRRYNKNPNKIGHIIIPSICELNNNFFENSNNKSYKKIRLILKSLASTDEMVTSKFQIIKCLGTSTNGLDRIVKNELDNDLEIIKIRNKIISKIFDKNGNPYPRLRQILIKENRHLFSEGKELIDTRNKCIKYFNNLGYTEPMIKDNNWVKWCLGDSLYEKIKDKFYKKEELYEVCDRLGIEDMLSYKNKHSMDEKLPPSEYINEGFYCSNFNLTKLLDSCREPIEI